MAVTLFEHTVYMLRIQLDCSSQWRTVLTATGCNLAQDVNVWIDLNDDGNFDQSEIGTPYRWPVTSYMAEGIYDIQIYVPALGNRYIRNGPHRMRIVVIPSEYYRRACRYHEYNQTREYMVTVIPRMKYSSLDATPTSQIPASAPCSPDVGKLILVVMAGEHRTQIWDDESTRAALTGNTQNYQHRAIVLYEDTVYLLRIQLECTGSRSRDSVENSCRLSHDVAAWIDLNDDGKFSDTENAAPYRWPLTSYIPQGFYDLQIYVPNIDGKKTKSGPHRMRLDVILNEQHRKKCGKNYYMETREYNVTIVQKSMKQAGYKVTHCIPDGFVCSEGSSAITLVKLLGEQSTQIRDGTKTCSSTNNYNDRSDLTVTLLDNTTYTLHIEFSCVQRLGHAYSFSKDSSLFTKTCINARYVGVWIDFNNNGIFNESTDRIISTSWDRNDPFMAQRDLNITIPQIDGKYYWGGHHRMRIVLTQDERSRNPCQISGYGEVRDYTVQIAQKPVY
ncbi:unnamed protein product [Rotaria sp. Silwood2]|nr:unnamed protein product [Rotaria sp. Silwood2]CAF4134081.1 unnamed protein product [Rotaria sp. Silwood2]